MVKLLVSAKGHGKTIRLIQMANESHRNADGNIVYIDHNKKHIYDIHSGIRFVETSACDIFNYREFVGFIFGILSQNSDIQEIYVDGLYKIIESLSDEDLVKLFKRLDDVGKADSVDFIIGMSNDKGTVPEEIKEYII